MRLFDARGHLLGTGLRSRGSVILPYVARARHARLLRSPHRNHAGLPSR